MSSLSTSHDSVDALKLLLHDVLIQTGKALRASRRDEEGTTAQVPVSSQTKLPDIIRAFHSSLDDIESSLIQAKAVLLRDINQLRAKRPGNPSSELPQLIQNPSKISTSVDTGPSPPSSQRAAQNQITSSHQEIENTRAYGILLNEHFQPTDLSVGRDDIDIKHETKQAGLTPDHSTMARDAEDAKSDEARGESKFTDIVFAPPVDDTYKQVSGNSEPFEPLVCQPDEGGSNSSIMDNILSTNRDISVDQSMLENGATVEAAKRQRNSDAEFDQIFGNDASQADGLDFDFSIGGNGGSGDDTFNDLILSRDHTYDAMGDDAFDSAFYIIDKQNET